MSRASVLRAVLALAVAVGTGVLIASHVGPLLLGGGVGVLVGVPGAVVELARAIVPIVVGLLVAVLAIRFGVRALRRNSTASGELARGGMLFTAMAWAAALWFLLELSYRQLWLGWATVFGSLGVALAWLAGAVVVCFVADRFVPWSRAPKSVRQFGFFVVVAVAMFTALSAWSHRDVVPRIALIPVALVGLALLASGVRRAGAGPGGRMFVELGLASLLLAAPIWSLFS